MKSKKGVGLVTGTIMFLILNIVFFGMMVIYVSSIGTGAEVVEDGYAKKIVLIIDSARPGTNIAIDISELYEEAEKNNFNGEVLNFTSDNRVLVKVTTGEGNSYQYFADMGKFNFELEGKNLIIEVKDE